MGKKSGKRGGRKNAAFSDTEDDDSMSSSSTAMSDLSQAPDIEEASHDKNNTMEIFLDALFEKRGSTREKALSSLADALSNNLQHEFVDDKFITLLHQLLNSFKRGSAKEISLASHVIGLLAVTVGCGDKGHEILEEMFPLVAQAVKSGSEPSKLSTILECLALITFVGGNDSEETERSLQLIWHFIHPKLGPNVVASKPSATVLAAAVSAWAFLLTTLDGWRCKLNSKNWKETISYLSSLLDKDDRTLRIAAGEAIAVIFEIGHLEKYNSELKDSDEGNNILEVYNHILGLRGKIISQVRNLSVEAGGRGSAKKDLTSQRNLFRDILEFLEEDYSPEVSTKIGGDSLNITTWSKLIQLNFLKRFLGGGFVKHMQENEFLHDVFDFIPKKKLTLGHEQQISSTEKRLFKSPNSVYNKARTQFLNKQRALSEGRNTGHYAVTLGGEDA